MGRWFLTRLLRWARGDRAGRREQPPGRRRHQARSGTRQQGSARQPGSAGQLGSAEPQPLSHTSARTRAPAEAPATARRSGEPGGPAGLGRHRREQENPGSHAVTPAAEPLPTYGSPVRPQPQAHSQPPSRPAGNRRSGGRRDGGSRDGAGADRAAVRPAPVDARSPASERAEGDVHAARRVAAGRARPGPPLPWYEVAHARRVAQGRRDCGQLEGILVREWEVGVAPPDEALRAIDRLAELPARIKEILAAGLDAIYVGAGGVPDLDEMVHLRDVPLPSGRATWDACAGAYGERKIIVGSRPSASPDVACHEVGHALDELDGTRGAWQSDGEDFGELYRRCLPHLVSDFHRQEGELGRREFFADAFAAIASRQRPALVDMLRGDTRSALEVMLYFNRRYGI